MTDNTEFFKQIDTVMNGLKESVSDVLIDYENVTPHMITAHLLMEIIGLGELEDAVVRKQRFVAMADHMGPDYAQEVYRAAVFMTKVV